MRPLQATGPGRLDLTKQLVVLKNTSGVGGGLKAQLRLERLAAKAVQRAALALERVHDVERGDCLAARVLGVGDRVADHVLQEDLEHAAGLLVDEAADTLDAAAACQAADGGLGDACSGKGCKWQVLARQGRLSTGQSEARKQASTWHSAQDDACSARQAGSQPGLQVAGQVNSGHAQACRPGGESHQSKHAPWMLSRRTLR